MKDFEEVSSYNESDNNAADYLSLDSNSDEENENEYQEVNVKTV